jgi:outer membrane protein OmpA-like peptidoglycan-associated protein
MTGSLTMRRTTYWLTTVTALALTAGCAQRPAALDQAQTALQSARADPDVATYAAAELDAAQTELQSANAAWEQGEGQAEAAHRADVALSQIQVAEAAAQARKSQAEITELGGQRDQVLRQAAEAQVASLREQLSNLQARQTERGIVLTVGDVLFDTGQAMLKPGAVNEIIRLAEFLKDNPERRVRIEGHTDSTGSLTTNLMLSQQRAEAVAGALAAAGVPRNQLEATGLGPDFPVASNATAAGRQQNRRVEVVIENAPATGARATSM